MPDPEPTTTIETQAIPSLASDPALQTESAPGLNVGLLLLFVVIVAAVVVQNVWLRRRADEESDSGNGGA